MVVVVVVVVVFWVYYAKTNHDNKVPLRILWVIIWALILCST